MKKITPRKCLTIWYKRKSLGIPETSLRVGNEVETRQIRCIAGKSNAGSNKMSNRKKILLNLNENLAYTDGVASAN